MNDIISLKAPMFSDAMQTADAALVNLVAKMKRKGADAGNLTISIRIEVEENPVEDPETGITSMCSVPQVTYKATYSVKDSQSLGGTNDGKGFGIIEQNGIPRLIELTEDQISMFGGGNV